jgi:hypothetical protein
MLLAGQEEVPLRARFELSKTALYEDAKQPQLGSHRVGLFQVTHFSKVEECTFLETGGDSLDQGFAYCPERLPEGANGSPATVFVSPVNGSWEDSDWWTYDSPSGLELHPEVN